MIRSFCSHFSNIWIVFVLDSGSVYINCLLNSYYGVCPGVQLLHIMTRVKADMVNMKGHVKNAG